MSYSGVTYGKGDPKIRLKFDIRKRLPKPHVGRDIRVIKGQNIEK